MKKPCLTLADVFYEYERDYRLQYGAITSCEQWNVIEAIKACRTAQLGGHVYHCDKCRHDVIVYNSCRNRHCPSCQGLANARWLEARRAELLPVEYYHVVFTLPDSLALIALQNKRVFYNLLFKAVSRTLLTIAAEPKHLGAKLGFLAILHTWTQTLLQHPHIHCVIPGGGFAPDKQRWVSCRKGFFLPVRVLSRLFRRIFLELLQHAFSKDELEFHGKLRHLALPARFKNLLKSCRKTEWVVFAKPPFAGPEQVLDYLARYTHRIAISHHRIKNIQNGFVTFTYKDRRNNDQQRTMTLSAPEFIRRFLLHTLPKRFVRIRYYGFIANRFRSQNLQLCRQLLNVDQTPPINPHKDMHWADLYESLTGENPLRCPLCKKGILRLVEQFPPAPNAYYSASKSRAPPRRRHQ